MGTVQSAEPNNNGMIKSEKRRQRKQRSAAHTCTRVLTGACSGAGPSVSAVSPADALLRAAGMKLHEGPSAGTEGERRRRPGPRPQRSKQA